MLANQDIVECSFASSCGDDQQSNYTTGEPRIQAYWRTLIADCKAYPIKRLNEHDITKYNSTFHETLEKVFDFSAFPSFEELHGGTMWPRMKLDWQFAVTNTGFFAMIPDSAQRQDEVVVLRGEKTPLILRAVEGAVTGSDGESLPAYILVVSAYVHGFMDGEARSWAEDGKLSGQQFVLV